MLYGLQWTIFHNIIGIIMDIFICFFKHNLIQENLYYD